MKTTRWVFALLFCCLGSSLWAADPRGETQKGLDTTAMGHWESVGNGQVLLEDAFDSSDGAWQEVYLEGASERGSCSVSGGRLVVETGRADSIYSLYHPTPLSGHFYAEADFAEEDSQGKSRQACGLALIQVKDGAPDTDNFTSIRVETNGEGKVAVRVRDRQNGVDDIFDNTGRLGPERYVTVLERQYSVPFDAVNKKLRIFRDGPAGFFHFYYAVKAKIRGKWVEGWMELAPSRDWAPVGTAYYVALYARSGTAPSARAEFNNLRVVQKPTEDRDDTETGFRAVRREYNWSGFFGDAVVISFGDDFAWRGDDRKFVFWSEMNYVPAWHLDNQLLFSYEFCETWGGGVPGCHEPMSDRLLRWSRVEILEDNAVRKITHWHYVLCNPDYKVPNDSVGGQLPEVDETWTFYPDGTGLRHIVYRPKLDTAHRKWHELTEPMAIAGSLTHPKEQFAFPALTVLNLEGDVDHYHPNKEFNPATNRWKQVIAAGHFKNAPDAFCAYSHDPRYPDTYSHYPISFQVSWHGTGYKMCHWPVGKEPYQVASKTHGTWKAQPSHSSLMGGGVHKGVQWSDHFKIDGRGRKYREWVMLAGLCEPNDLNEMRNRTRTWLDPGTITMEGPSSAFEKNNHRRRELIFNNRQGDGQCRFTIDPTPNSATVINPVFKIKNWGDRLVAVSINGRALEPNRDFKTATAENGAALIWVKARFDAPATFHVNMLSPNVK